MRDDVQLEIGHNAFYAARWGQPEASEGASIDDACRAYHKAMIAATPGLSVHEVDGTVRRPWSRDL